MHDSVGVDRTLQLLQSILSLLSVTTLEGDMREGRRMGGPGRTLKGPIGDSGRSDGVEDTGSDGETGFVRRWTALPLRGTGPRAWDRPSVHGGSSGDSDPGGCNDITGVTSHGQQSVTLMV